MNRVAVWNGGTVPKELQGVDKLTGEAVTTRGNTEFKPSFDLGLLSEEVQEFYKAMAEKDLVEMVDAFCDVRFVWEGIMFKYGMIKYSYNCDIKEFNENELAFKAIEHYVQRHLTTMVECLEVEFGRNSHKLQNVLNLSYGIVCTANEQKGTQKDEKDKTVKGDKWRNPGPQIKELLIGARVL